MAREEFEEIIRIESEAHVTKLVMEEYALTSHAMILIGSYEYDYMHNKDFDPARHKEGKEKLFASLIVDKGRTSDDPWLIFLNGVIPGDIVDMQSAAFQQKLIDAMEQYANEQEQQEIRNRILDQIKTVILNGREADTDEIVKTIHIAGKVMAVAVTVFTKAERESQVREVCRSEVLDESIVTEILTILETEFPVES